jgi:hypothetical protein
MTRTLTLTEEQAALVRSLVARDLQDLWDQQTSAWFDGLREGLLEVRELDPEAPNDPELQTQINAVRRQFEAMDDLVTRFGKIHELYERLPGPVHGPLTPESGVQRGQQIEEADEAQDA